MKWFKKLFKSKEKERRSINYTEKEKLARFQESQKINEELDRILELREVLKDKNGEDLICNLCENWDNELNKYYPIYEGEKQTFQGKAWHTGCLRAFRKEAKKGNLI